MTDSSGALNYTIPGVRPGNDYNFTVASGTLYTAANEDFAFNKEQALLIAKTKFPKVAEEADHAGERVHHQSLSDQARRVRETVGKGPRGREEQQPRRTDGVRGENHHRQRSDLGCASDFASAFGRGPWLLARHRSNCSSWARRDAAGASEARCQQPPLPQSVIGRSDWLGR